MKRQIIFTFVDAAFHPLYCLKFSIKSVEFLTFMEENIGLFFSETWGLYISNKIEYNN